MEGLRQHADRTQADDKQALCDDSLHPGKSSHGARHTGIDLPKEYLDLWQV